MNICNEFISPMHQCDLSLSLSFPLYEMASTLTLERLCELQITVSSDSDLNFLDGIAQKWNLPRLRRSTVYELLEPSLWIPYYINFMDAYGKHLSTLSICAQNMFRYVQTAVPIWSTLHHLSPAFNLLDMAYVQMFLGHCFGLKCHASFSHIHGRTFPTRYSTARPCTGVFQESTYSVMQGSYAGGSTKYVMSFVAASDGRESL
ncbi:uncharacterized protein BJ212DRAFT_44858 [Suillus subaureus]|uniref:Uncharacterized protein n=1 Tax=Suillus subaureus TaxID=48587 RepID=A0A9P7EQ61_9AGAM|nr:uncharacterized protein BJ212DRAFT_44858 [Suillus subaureus]KAG1827311.1 hypothetical protein BJ212DRAFT_44858 [Suillus subaureus]